MGNQISKLLNEKRLLEQPLIQWRNNLSADLRAVNIETADGGIMDHAMANCTVNYIYTAPETEREQDKKCDRGERERIASSNLKIAILLKIFLIC